MNRSLFRHAVTIIACTSLLAAVPWIAHAKTIAMSVKPLSEETVRARADALLAQMTPEEKAGQLSLYFYFSAIPQLTAGVHKSIEQASVGSLVYVSNPTETNRLQKLAMEHSRLKIPLLFGYDVLHGLRTIFPVPLAMAASWDTKLVEDAQRIAASEARAVGIHLTFGPNVDITHDPRFGRIVEAAGEDSYLGSAMAAAQVRGFQGPFIGSPGHIIAGPKHFVGYGASLGGRDYDEVNLSDNELWNVHLPPFKAAIDAGAGNVMSAYMALNGVPASSNQWLLTKVLRDTWGFKGFVVTDNGAVSSLTTHGQAIDSDDAAIRALKAGVNLEMIVPGRSAAMKMLPDALQAGKISKSALDDAVRPLLEAKIRMGLFETPYVDEAKAAAVLGDPSHLAAARIAAERSAVLLRNENSLLPLDRHTIKSIAVIGPLADSSRDILGPWVFQENEPPSVTVLAGLRAKLGKSVRVDYSEGVRIPPRMFPSPVEMMTKPVIKPSIDEPAEFKRAVDLASAADVAVLVLGEAQDMIGEIASRSSLDLPGRQQELLDAVVATGKPVVVLLMSARPINLNDTKARAILDIWYPGSEGGNAVANLLFGDAAPGGKLPFTWIRNAAQAPMSYSHLNTHSPNGINKRYWNESNEPIYPFGYGLSYTTFEYSNLQIEHPAYTRGQPVVVSVDVKNNGRRAGDEVAQLYIHQQSGTSARPVRELKGFQRITLKPGETRKLNFTIKPDNLSYWSDVTKSWIQDSSTFNVWIGGSSTATLGSSFVVR